MKTLLSYKGDKQLKSSLLKEIKKHREADQIIQGTYGTQNGTWKGCAIACSLRSLAIIKGEELVTKYNEHSRYETDLGIPEWLARLEDMIFEGLPVKDSKTWPEKFTQAIPVGINLEPVKWHFCSFILKENIERVLKLSITDELKKQVVDSIRGALAVHENAITAGQWDESAAESAARSAESAAESAARSAVWSAVWSAESAAWSAAWLAESAAESAESAAWSAESAAWSAAWLAESAAESAAWSAAWSAAYKRYAKELLRLLKSTN